MEYLAAYPCKAGEEVQVGDYLLKRCRLKTIAAEGASSFRCDAEEWILRLGGNKTQTWLRFVFRLSRGRGTGESIRPGNATAAQRTSKLIQQLLTSLPSWESLLRSAVSC